MANDLFDRIPVIDVDTHVTEPADTWTSRVAKKWGDKVPRLERVGEKDVNGILDAVMRVGAEVVSVTPHRSCLEDVFLDAVRAGDEAASEPGGEG